MSGLAKYMLGLGKQVGGSDVSSSEYVEELAKCGAKINLNDNAEDISGYDFIVYTDAVSDNDLRYKKALELNKPLMSRGQFLYEVSKNFKTVIAVSGCHGKTTCTAMLAHIFAAADKKFTAHIGGRDLAFSNFYCCGHDFFITEACEYKKNFLHLKPDVSVVLNSELDHVECYGSEEALKKAYVDFAESAVHKVALYNDLPISGITFGFANDADYFADDVKVNGGNSIFTVYERGEKECEVTLNVYGKHNILNALAATAVARTLGISYEHISDGLNLFKGVERRFEKLAEVKNTVYYADYAHHPNELLASLKTVRAIAKGNIFVVFQPHTYSRTKLLFDNFIDVLSPLKNLLIYKTFAAREYFDDAGSALTLAQNIRNADYGDCVDDIRDFISKAKEGDVVIFLGAGDIYFIAKQICGELN